MLARTSVVKRPRCSRALEGKKGWPRLKPPFPAVVGLCSAHPTVVNNVETIASVARSIFEKGAEAWFMKLGLPARAGGTRTRDHLWRGDIEKPGTYEVAMDTTRCAS